MTLYEFQCPKCRRVFSVLQDPHGNKRAKCPDCGAKAERVFGYAGFRIAEANGPDGINMTFGKHFESNRERDYFADEHGWRKV